MFLFFFNFPSLSTPAPCNWSTVLPHPPPFCPNWECYCNLPVAIHADLQWRITHWVLPTNSLLHQFSQIFHKQCLFCGQIETVLHVYVGWNSLTPLLRSLKILFARLSFVFSFSVFILAPVAPSSLPMAVLVIFKKILFTAQANLVI